MNINGTREKCSKNKQNEHLNTTTTMRNAKLHADVAVHTFSKVTESNYSWTGVFSHGFYYLSWTLYTAIVFANKSTYTRLKNAFLAHKAPTQSLFNSQLFESKAYTRTYCSDCHFLSCSTLKCVCSSREMFHLGNR